MYILTDTRLDNIAKDIAGAWMATNKKLLDAGQSGWPLDDNIDKLIFLVFSEEPYRQHELTATERDAIAEKVMEYTGQIIAELRKQNTPTTISQGLQEYIVERCVPLFQSFPSQDSVEFDGKQYEPSDCDRARIEYMHALAERLAVHRADFQTRVDKMETTGSATLNDHTRLTELDRLIGAMEIEEKAAASFSFA